MAPWTVIMSGPSPISLVQYSAQMLVIRRAQAPEQMPLAIDDLHIDSEDPEVKMPAAKSALLFPKTNFFKKIPTGDGVPTPDPFLGDPLGAAGNPNDIPL